MSQTRVSSLAERLGFDADARVAIVHADDIGMCHSANLGAFEALRAGPATCGSLMVPCPWFPEAVRIAAEEPQHDLGVHLTLNSEWEHYRWGPVAGAGEVPSLCAPDGRLYRSTAEVVQHARPEEVEIELRAQIEAALAAGVDVTHLDSHMGTVFMPPFVAIYGKLAREYRLAAFVTRPPQEVLEGHSSETFAALLREIDAMEADGIPVLDGFDSHSLEFGPGEGEAHNLARLERMGPGVHYLICHPAQGGEELDAITQDAHCRDFERAFYGGETGRKAFEAQGIATVGMREIRALVRG